MGGSNPTPQPPSKSFGMDARGAASNEQGTPLPWLAGRRRFAGTFITDAFDQSSSTAGGGKKSGGSTGTNYYCSFAVAFCLGPADGIHGLFFNGDDVFTSNTAVTPANLSQAQNVALFQTSNPHGIPDGSYVLIVGADQPEFNGEFLVKVLDAYSFQYNIPGSSLVAETASGQIQCYQKLAPIFRGAEDSVTVTIPEYGTLTLYWGTETQNADVYLQVSGSNQPPMRGVCYAVFHKFWLGLNQTNIQNIEVVLSRTPSAAWQANADDNNISNEANPAIAIYDLLTSPRAGCNLKVTDFNTADFASVAARLATENLGLSPILTRADDALNVVQQICDSIDGLLLLDANGLLTIKLIRAPDYTQIVQLTDSQLASIPKMKALDWSNAINQTRLVFPNADALWQNDFVEWFDFGSITSGINLAQPQTLQRDMVTSRTVAQALVQAAGAAGSIPLVSGSMDLLFTTALFASLAPGTLFQSNFATAAEANGIFRVTKRVFKKSDQPVFTVEFQADRSYLNFTP